MDLAARKKTETREQEEKKWYKRAYAITTKLAFVNAYRVYTDCTFELMIVWRLGASSQACWEFSADKEGGACSRYHATELLHFVLYVSQSQKRRRADA